MGSGGEGKGCSGRAKQVIFSHSALERGEWCKKERFIAEGLPMSKIFKCKSGLRQRGVT